MRIFLIVCLLIGCNPIVSGQVSRHKKKNSTAPGTLYFYWGYNRSYYTHSDIRFAGANYDFKLKNAVAFDRPDPFRADVYLNPKKITVPQYNARIGYYFKDKWALSLGVDHFKYVLADRNEVLLDGFIGAGIDTNWAGTYSDQPVVTNRELFHYENTNGVNFIRAELTRSFMLLELGQQRQLVFTAHLGASTGPILTYSDLNFEQLHTFATPSISGYGLSVNGGLRAEFFKHFFLQINSGLGMIHLTHVRTRPDDRNAFARQIFGYSEYNIAAGALFYLHPKNGCDSCPHW